MKQSNLPQLSEILLVLNNINDNLRRCEERLCKLENEKSIPSKHIVILRKEDKKIKGDK